LPTSSSEQSSLRQPPTVTDTTAAAFLRSTLAMAACLSVSVLHIRFYFLVVFLFTHFLVVGSVR